jgi:hypothetical protein
MFYCQDCIQATAESVGKGKNRFQCWAAVGYNFKWALLNLTLQLLYLNLASQMRSVCADIWIP